MKSKLIYLLFAGIFTLSLVACKKDPAGTSNTPTINVTGAGTVQDFGFVLVGLESAPKNFQVSGSNLTGSISISASDGYKVSLDNSSYTSSVTIPASETAAAKTFYVKFYPVATGVKTGTVTLQSSSAATVTLNFSGTGNASTHSFTTFSSERLAFGTGLSQSAVHQYTFVPDVTVIEKVKMFIKLRCPAGGCNAWDVFAHVQVKDPSSGDWYEMGRYITPYGVDNHNVTTGFEIDVTDFKSLLEGTVSLRAYIETWGSDGWLLSVNFDFVDGTPDYPYYAVSKVLQYNQNSLEGVIYGEDASAFDLTKSITIPANSEATHLRTIITGWGHATPNDPDGRPCAEWCYRTHNIKINGANTFSHYMGPIGCSSNPVQPQGGNWQPDRAGWCPGMAVPVRKDQFAGNMAGQTFSFEYSFSPWVNNLLSTAANIHAYNAISTYVVVKSNTPIVKPTVMD